MLKSKYFWFTMEKVRKLYPGVLKGGLENRTIKEGRRQVRKAKPNK